MSPVIQGFVANRKRQWGYQGSNANLITTAVAAARVLPWRGAPSVNPNWTFEDVDDGSLLGVQSPSMRRWDITSPPAGPLAYNDLPYLLTPLLHGGVTATGGGAAKTWTHQPNYKTPASTPLGMVTEEFGDDVTTDWWQLSGGVFETCQITGTDGAGPLQVSGTMRFAKAAGSGLTNYVASPTVPTALNLDTTPNWVYLDDCELFINSTAGAIGTTKITDALETLSLTVTNTLDLKSWANGSNTRFQTAGYGRGDVTIEVALTFAKTSQTVGTGSETDKLYNPTPQERFVELRFTSPEIITGSTPFSWRVRLPGFYTIRADGEAGGNTNLTLTGNAKDDSTLGYGINSVAVCEQADLTT